MTAVRVILVVVAGLAVLVAGMMSATLLDFEPGAWIAFTTVALFTVARIAISFGLWAGDIDDLDIDG